ncbi:MAG: helix-turn-helix domain-containing protein [Blastocatellia bacterium]
MGRASRPKPARLAEKLVRIRAAFGLSQNELISRLGLTKEILREDISAFERGIREPPLPILLKYARLAGIYVDALIDDEVQLPEHLPAPAKFEWARRRTR